MVVPDPGAPSLTFSRTLRAATTLMLVAGVLHAPVTAAGQDAMRYRRSAALIARQQAADDSVAAPGARSIFLTDGQRSARVIVLFHGLTDSPRQFDTLAFLLHAAGDNVYVPRLPRHGVRGGDAGTLATLTADELRRHATAAIDIARDLGDSVIVVGLSLGGTMAAWVTQHQAVSRTVIIAPAIQVGRVPSIFARFVVGLAAIVPNITRRDMADPARPDREPGFSTHAAAQIIKLGMAVMADARRNAASTPAVAVLVNAHDRTVKRSASEELARRWAAHGARVSLYELPDSLRLPHNILDPFRGTGGGLVIQQLIRALIHDETPTTVVRRLPMPAGADGAMAARADAGDRISPH